MANDEDLRRFEVDKLLELEFGSFKTRRRYSVAKDYEVGLSRSDVEKVWPELIGTTRNGYHYLKQHKLHTAELQLLQRHEAILQDHQHQIDCMQQEYQQQIAKLQQELDDLKARIK